MTTTVYDSKQPLIAGSAFVFAAVLFQRANSQLIQTVPTLAVGDVKISIDGGGYTNITTLPTEVGTTGELIVSLSGAETTGVLKYISVKFADATGAEWCDVVYVIDVEEAKVVSNYAGGDTSGVTTMLADYARRTGDYATVTALSTLQGNVTTILTDYARRTGDYATVAALSTLQGNVTTILADYARRTGDYSVLTAALVWNALTSGLTTVGSIGKLLVTNIDQTISSVDIAVGAGSVTVPITINDGTNPLDGVDVWATTDSAGANVVARGSTNTSGLVTFYLDAGTYYIWKTLAGYTFTNPSTLVVV